MRRCEGARCASERCVHILAIAKRELRSYFVSPIAYAALTTYALLSGFFFSNS